MPRVEMFLTSNVSGEFQTVLPPMRDNASTDESGSMPLTTVGYDRRKIVKMIRERIERNKLGKFSVWGIKNHRSAVFRGGAPWIC